MMRDDELNRSIFCVQVSLHLGGCGELLGGIGLVLDKILIERKMVIFIIAYHWYLLLMVLVENDCVFVNVYR